VNGTVRSTEPFTDCLSGKFAPVVSERICSGMPLVMNSVDSSSSTSSELICRSTRIALTFCCVLIYYVQNLHSPSIGCPFSHEIMTPDMVSVLRSQPHTGAIIEPQPAPFGLTFGDFQSFPSPYSLHSPMIHPPALLLKQSRYHPISITAILLCRCYNSRHQPLLIIRYLHIVTLCGSGLPTDFACPSL